MYLVEDESFTEILGGEFFQVIVAKKLKPDITMAELYNYQFKYDTYDGFRKFYQKHLKPIIDGIRLIDDKSVLGKAIRFLTNEKNK